MKNLVVDNPKQSINNVKVGKGVKIYDFVNAHDCSIDDYSMVGTFVEIQRGVRIGKKCKISSHTFICEDVQVEDNVFKTGSTFMFAHLGNVESYILY